MGYLRWPLITPVFDQLSSLARYSARRPSAYKASAWPLTQYSSSPSSTSVRENSASALSASPFTSNSVWIRSKLVKLRHDYASQLQPPILLRPNNKMARK